MIVVHFICDLLEGGAQKSAISLIENTNDQVKNHLVLLEDRRKYEPEGVAISSVVVNKKKYKKLGALGDYLLAGKLRKVLREIEKNEGAPVDVVISHMEVTAKVLHYLKGYRKIFYIRVNLCQELEALNRLSKQRGKRRKALYQKIHNGQEVIGVSQGVLEDLSKIPVLPARAECIYTPFDIERIRRLSLSTAVEVPVYQYMIHPTSYRNAQKRHDVLFKALKLMKNPIKLVMLSDPVEPLLRMIEEIGVSDRVVVYGHQLNPYPLIRNARLTVLSSDREGLPRVLVESLALQTPVVSTDCPSGPREIMHGDLSNYLCEMNDPDDLAAKLDLALESYPAIEGSYMLPYGQGQNAKKFLSYLESVC